jgi:ParB family transcriptional regulator, chromosome partitioning protein
MSKADKLGASASFGQARPVSARRAAIGAATGAPTAGVPDPTELPLALISQNPDNPREELRELDELAQSIAELGVINAITIASVDAYLLERPERTNDLDEGAKYIVVDGHRRLEGARQSGLTKIKVHVDDDRVASDEALLEAAFVSNFHRDDMTDLEQAHALESLVRFYGSQSKAAKRLGISQPTISAKLSLLKLSPELQADLAAGRRHVEHVRNLGKLAPEEQLEAADSRRAEAQRRAELRNNATPEVPAAEEERSAASEDLSQPTAATTTTSEPRKTPLGNHATTPPPPSETNGSGPARAKDTTVPRGRRREDPRITSVPWNDPQAVVRIAREHMTAEDFRTAGKLWQALDTD